MKIVGMNLSILVILLFLTSCGANSDQQNAQNLQNINTNQANTNQAKITANDNVEELETTIKMPFHPEEALWREDNYTVREGENSAGQNAKKLTAVLKFSPEDAAKIITAAEPKKTVTQTTLAVETWFPAELVALSELSGDDTLKGNVYSADQFFQTPYLDGRLIRMENSNYFVLELFAK